MVPDHTRTTGLLLKSGFFLLLSPEPCLVPWRENCHSCWQSQTLSVSAAPPLVPWPFLAIISYKCIWLVENASSTKKGYVDFWSSPLERFTMWQTTKLWERFRSLEKVAKNRDLLNELFTKQNSSRVWCYLYDDFKHYRGSNLNLRGRIRKPGS